MIFTFTLKQAIPYASAIGGVTLSVAMAIYTFGGDQSKKQAHNTKNDEKIEWLVKQMDTVLRVQKVQLDNQAILDTKIDSLRNMTITVKNIVKEHIIIQAKDKFAIIKAVQDFGPYYNFKYEKKNIHLKDSGHLNYFTDPNRYLAQVLKCQ